MAFSYDGPIVDSSNSSLYLDERLDTPRGEMVLISCRTCIVLLIKAAYQGLYHILKEVPKALVL